MLLAVLLVGGAWMGWSALQSRHDLQAARQSLSQVRTALLDGDLAHARAALDDARSHAASAHDHTAGPLWALAADIPVVGDVAETSRGVAAAADEVVSGPLSTLVDTADGVRPASLWAHHRVAVDRLDAVAPRLTHAGRRLAQVRNAVAGLPAHTVLGSVDRARAAFLTQLSDLRDTVTGAARLARVTPDMLGAHGHRRYLLVVQNPAEARGTGGIIGAYAVLSARHGRIHVVRTGPNTDLHNASRPVTDLAEEFDRRYNGFAATRVWQQANPSPHFPDAARIWLALWHHQTGQRLDGVIATDPVAMGYLLQATGPVRLRDGERITGGNAVRRTLHDAYARYADNDRRDAYFQQIAGAVLHHVLGGSGDATALFRQLGRTADERRLQVYSTHPETERDLADSTLGGVLPDRPGPYAGLVVNDIAGSKLDYYLDRSVSYSVVGDGGCRADTRHTRITVRLTNTAPKHGLPPYVVAHLPGHHRPRGTVRLLVSVFLPQHAEVGAVRMGGAKVLAGAGLEREHPVVSKTLDLRPGQARTLRIDLTEPVVRGPGPAGSTGSPRVTAPVPARVPAQPLVRPQQTTVHVPAC